MSTTNSHTEVKQVESDLAAILGAPSGDNVIIPTKNNLLANTKHEPLKVDELAKAAQEKAAKDKAAADLKVKEEADRIAAEELAKKKEGKTPEELAIIEEEEKKKKEIAAKAAASGKSLVEELTATTTTEEDESIKGKGGRPEFQKQGLIQVANDLIKEGKFIPLDDPKPMEEWTKEDFKEFIELNLEHKQKEVAEEVPIQFFDALPPEFQTAFTYLENLRGAKGGYTPQDVQHILKVVTQAVNITNLDASTEEGQEDIVRNFLTMTEFGTPDEIDEEVSAIKDRNELEKKAGQFKPKLDAIQQKNIEKNIKATEQARVKAEKQAGVWMDTVFKALEPAEVGGMKLNKKEQTELYNSLVQPNYQSFTGQPTNELGHLIESKQFGKEQDLEAVFLARMILKDKKGTLERIREQGASGKAAEVAKKLKIEQANRGTAAADEEEMAGANRATKKLVRKQNNIFK